MIRSLYSAVSGMLPQMTVGRTLVGSLVDMKDLSGELISGKVDKVVIDSEGVHLDVLGRSLPIENLIAYGDAPGSYAA